MSFLVTFIASVLCFFVGANSSFALSKDRMTWSDPQYSGTVLQDGASDVNRRGRNVAYSQLPFAPNVGISRQGLDDPSVAIPRSGYEDDGGAVSGNFQLAIPVIDLPGRGINLSLVLYYSSLVWGTVGNQRLFNPDADWPAPGWSLGFGKLGSFFLVDSDMTRHPLGRVDQTHRRTTDGTFIDIEDRPCVSDTCTSIVHYPTGLTAEFDGANNESVDRVPTKITDRNGNFITISYLSPFRPAISQIVDTVGRKFNFEYDANGNLIGIYALDQHKDLLRLHYFFPPPYLSAPHQLVLPKDYLIDAIIDPAKGTGFWFGGISWGCYNRKTSALFLVNWQTGMNLSGATSTNQGVVVAQGNLSRQRQYSYSRDMSTNAPYISKIAETWAGDSAVYVTKYDVSYDQQNRYVTITYPDGSQNQQTADSGSGLVYISTVKTRDGRALSMQLTQWETGADGLPRAHSVTNQNELGNSSKTVFEYGSRNEITAIDEYGFDSSLFRRKTISYLKDPAYESQHILNLPIQEEVFEGNSPTPVSRTDYKYDDAPLENAPGAVQHLAEYDPFQQPPGAAQHGARGNLTSITRFADASGATGSASVEFRYDIAGNLTSVSHWQGTETRYIYSSATQFAYPDSIVMGSTDPASPVRMTERYTYDMNIGRPQTYIDVNGRMTRFDYFNGILTESSPDDGPIVSWTYSYGSMGTIRRELKNHANSTIALSIYRLDGRSQIIRIEDSRDNGAISYRNFIYDFAGNTIAETLPHDATVTNLKWTNYVFDALGRLISRTAPDGGIARFHYNEVGRPASAGGILGNSVHTSDAWGRERWYLLDAASRITEMVEPDTTNPGRLLAQTGFVSKYKFDALDDLTRIDQDSQTREFAFDSLGRLIAQQIPEQAKTLSNSGNYTQVPVQQKWSEARSYDDRTGQLKSVSDARGIKTVFDYGQDPLGRLQSISYFHALALGISGSNTNTPTVIPVEPTTYKYVASGNLFRVETVNVGDSVRKVLSYESNNDRVMRIITNIDPSIYSLQTPPGTRLGFSRDLSLVLFYNYDDIGRVTSVGESEILPGTPIGSGLSLLNSPTNSYTKQYWLGGKLASSDITIKNFINSNWRVWGTSYNPFGEILTRSFSLTTPLAGLFGWSEEFGYNNQWLGHHAVTGTDFFFNPKKFYDAAYDFTYPKTGFLAHLQNPAVGQITKLADSLYPDANQELTYDSTGRLLTAKLGQAGSSSGIFSTQTYSYDRFGNRVMVASTATSCNGSSCAPVAGVADGWPELSADPSSNRIVQNAIAYDESGNIISAPRLNGHINRYQYDAAGRLSTVFDENGNLLEHYAYGSDRRRLVTISGSGNTTAYIWSGQALLAEHSIQTTAQQFNVPNPEGGILVSFGEDDQGTKSIRYHISDRGALRLTMAAKDDDAGTAGDYILTRRSYHRPFGSEPSAQALGLSGFANYERSSATGLDYAVNRFYDPEQGRFLQPDPLGVGAFDVGSPQTANSYVFAHDDPSNVRDPIGLLSCQDPPPPYTTCVHDYSYAPSPDVVVGDTSFTGSGDVAPSPGGGSGSGPTPSRLDRFVARERGHHERITTCRDNALNDVFGPLLAKGIRLGSLGEMSAHPMEFIKTLAESVGVKGGLAVGVPAYMNVSSLLKRGIAESGSITSLDPALPLSEEAVSARTMNLLIDAQEEATLADEFSAWVGAAGHLGTYVVGAASLADGAVTLTQCYIPDVRQTIQIVTQ